MRFACEGFGFQWQKQLQDQFCETSLNSKFKEPKKTLISLFGFSNILFDNIRNFICLGNRLFGTKQFSEQRQ